MVNSIGCLEALKSCAITPEYMDWFGIVALILMIVFAGISILFIISRATNRKDWEAIARAELYQAGVATLWVILIAMTATSSCSITCVVIGEENPFEVSSAYLASINSKIQGISENLFDTAKDIRFASAFNIGFMDVYANPWQGCGVIADSYENLAVMLTPFIGSLITQQYILVLIGGIVFKFLLPLGIILRLIPFTRETGAFLIALSFAFYIVYPLTYVFAAKATAEFMPSIETIGSPGLNCNNPAVAEKILVNIGKTLPQTVFFPALSMILTIATARALSKVFSYDFREIR